MADTSASTIEQRIAYGLRAKLGLTEDQCYVAAAVIPVDGQGPLVIQVVPGSESPDGEGHGWQDGGNLCRRAQFTLAMFHTILLDQHGWSQEALTRTADGILAVSEQVRDVLAGGALGSDVDLPEPIRYEGQSQTQVMDMDKGTFLRTMTISQPYVIPLTSDGTLDDSDFSTSST